jgi:hypothetical protein
MKRAIVFLSALALSAAVCAAPPQMRVNKFIAEGYAAYTEAERVSQTPASPGTGQLNIRTPARVITAGQRATAQKSALWDARTKASEYCHHAKDGYDSSRGAINLSVLMVTDDGLGYRVFMAHDCEKPE